MKKMRFFCPGRVNIIGDHIDYNGGLVLPAAISLGITAEVETTDDGSFYFYSTAHPQIFSFLATELPQQYFPENDWCNYPLAALHILQQSGYPLTPCKIVFSATLPEGAGLSSSAAIEVLTIFIQQYFADLHLSRKEIACMAQNAERNFIRMNCGIMDQYAVANGVENHAMLLDCEKIEHSIIPFELDDYAVVIMHTKKPRALIHSAYNERRAESEKALAILQQKNKVLINLVDAAIEELDEIEDELIQKRARHVISEQIRVKHAAKALEMGDLHTLGRLLDASHTSLKQQYEVSCIELDTIVEEGRKIEGCIGARMTGAGFGGCAIALVQRSKLTLFTQLLPVVYAAKIGYECALYQCEIAEGVSRIE